jgi:N-acetylglucosaminyl-diphospho-decaprenol L-rhamnosyltransferase
VRVGLATIQRGRHLHLARQVHGLASMARRPERYVVVSMDREAPDVPGADVVHRPIADGAPLPLAEARNAAVAALGDVDLAVLLDVDCIPSPDLTARYAAAASGPAGDGLLAGPVGRLAALASQRLAPSCEELANARAAAGSRPVPPTGALVREPRVELFWSLSFAVRPAVHARVGGFDEGYVGYGAEDTDYAFRARAAGCPLHWVGGAWAYHQHHPVSSPPREHLEDIVANARRFRERWSRWPMEGWLAAFADEGLVRWDPARDRLERATDQELTTRAGAAPPTGRAARADARGAGGAPRSAGARRAGRPSAGRRASGAAGG